MNRRQLIAGLSGAAAWPIAARAQQGERMRRIGVLMNLATDDEESTARITAFAQGLQEAGWAVGRDVRVDYRWAAGDPRRFQRYAEELLALSPVVVVAAATPSVLALQQATHTVPIVFVGVTDPVGAGFVESLARPGGNTTGFMPFEFGISAKWLELLKEAAPKISHVAVIRDAVGVGQLAAIQALAPSFGVELTPIGVGNAGEIERGLTAFAHAYDGGLIVTSSPLTGVHRNLIISLAARYRLPATYPFPYFTAVGGLISYGPDLIDEYRRAAGYVDRILKGANPADLPVQAPTKHELIIT
jgi:putative ABC transport system substrate-binding protein